ncbi:methyltransferase-like protein [Leptotrombidium deliense]|uniref:Methyltransferase-like protein n=1 Tax=Leptotrombidium deliense TaxID=299467 RepID=A0A443SJD3_9ACAR|nr:methyltransferase-like protein [Leptotrombidium deliense]
MQDQPIHSKTVRVLTDQEKAKLESDVNLVSTFRQVKLEKEAKKNWDLFYKRNETRFFKDRHWTTREFQELVGDDFNDTRPTLLEVGAGVGNFFYPLIEEGTKFFVYACDFSPVAVNLIKANALYDEINACKAFVSDITSEQFLEDFRQCCGSDRIDVITLMFVLSAINPNKMLAAITNLYEVSFVLFEYVF